MLGVPGEMELRGKGISYCATCDGDFFQDRNILVVGGGNSALEEAVSLTKYASSVTIIHQFDHFQASRYAVEEAQRNPKISFIMESTIAAFKGGEAVEGVTLRHIPTGETREVAIDGVFIFIGHTPNSDLFRGQLAIDDAGYVGGDVGDWLEIFAVDGFVGDAFFDDQAPGIGRKVSIRRR